MVTVSSSVGVSDPSFPGQSVSKYPPSFVSILRRGVGLSCDGVSWEKVRPRPPLDATSAPLQPGSLCAAVWHVLRPAMPGDLSWQPAGMHERVPAVRCKTTER